MVRSALAYGVLVVVGLAFTTPATAAREEPGDETDSAGVAPALPPQTPAAPAPEASGKGLTPCTVCAPPSCKSVQLRGQCTVDEAMKALVRHRQAVGLAQGPQHRSRSVTGADYERLVIEELPQPGRAKAAPQHQPQGETDDRQLSGLAGSGPRPPVAGTSDSLSVKAQSFRPLDLNEDTADEDETSDEPPAEAEQESR